MGRYMNQRERAALSVIKTKEALQEKLQEKLSVTNGNMTWSEVESFTKRIASLCDRIQELDPHADKRIRAMQGFSGKVFTGKLFITTNKTL